MKTQPSRGYHVNDKQPRHFGMTRRKALYAVTTSVIALGAVAALWPAIDHLNPDTSVTPPEIEVDLSSVEPGQSLTFVWRRHPIFIRHRTEEEIEKARSTPLNVLRDVDARVMDAETSLLATDENRTKPGKANWLLVVGVCTRDNCLLRGQSADGYDRGDYGGWLCPCCSAHYDTSGRTQKGIAPQNLRVPPYRFTGDTRVTIGCGLCRAAFLT